MQIGEVVRNGVVFDAKNWRGSDMNPDSLRETVERLFILLAERQIAYVLVGGVALLQYVEGRNTQDIDLIMALAEIDRLPEIQLTSQDANFARGEFAGLQIDILRAENPLFARVKQAYTTVQDFAGQPIPTATVEGLIVLKLYALPSLYRQGNFARVGLYENDIATLLHYHQPDMTALLLELSPYLSASDRQEVQQILHEIEQRLSRFQKGTGQ